MGKLFYVFQIIIFSAQPLLGQNDQGSRLTAMGNNGTAVKDTWGTAANPAAISGMEGPSIQTSYKRHFFAKELSSGAISLVLPIKRYSFGLYLQRTGTPDFTTSSAGLIVTKQFGPNLSLGLRANYHQIQISSYGTTNGFSFAIGTFYKFNNELSIGFYLNNPSKETYSTKSINLTIPTSGHFGIAYQASNKFIIATSLSKQLLTPFDIAIGFDYQLIKSFNIRSAVSLKPFKQYGGFAITSNNFTIDIAFTRHPSLGYSPQITIGYVF